MKNGGLLIAASMALVLVLSFTPDVAARQVGAPHARGLASAYGWPIKPFDRPHPVRGNFGDPRTIFAGPPTAQTLFHGRGSFAFHRGIDIAAPAGTPVYPVRDGLVSYVNASHIAVSSFGGTVFEYWHLRANVSFGMTVHTDETVLGRTGHDAHVDLTEVEGGRPVNPLALGHLTPYFDSTRPTISDILLQSDNAGHERFANFVRGRIIPVAEVSDRTALPVPGEWRAMPVTPALVTWRIQRLNGAIVVPEQVAVDFRSSEPSNNDFWAIYARGTYQNMAVFGKHESYMQPGCYMFRLTPSSIDTHSLHDGIYDIVVTATDIRGNSSSRSLRFTVHNRPGWVGS